MAHTATVIGGGPAGLMAAEVLARAGARVDLFEAMPTPGRKFLRAGVGGLNLTRDEDSETSWPDYGAARNFVAPHLAAFGPAEARAWADGLGAETFIGSSGKIFPKAMKAAPLLRAWLARLDGLGVLLHPRHRWRGWTADGALAFAAPDGDVAIRPDATVLALGGASWPRLGSDGGWRDFLAAHGVGFSPWRPANCGFDVEWSAVFRDRFAGAPLSTLVFSFGGTRIRGNATITEHGIEGGAIYALFRRPARRHRGARIGDPVHRPCPRPLRRRPRPRPRPTARRAVLRHPPGPRGNRRRARAALARETSPGIAALPPAAQAAAIKARASSACAPAPSPRRSARRAASGWRNWTKP
jgi:predicted Rossmann fold flavoprotein